MPISSGESIEWSVQIYQTAEDLEEDLEDGARTATLPI